MDQTLIVMYSCKMCGLHRIKRAVKIRGEEDAPTWMRETVVPAIAADHFARSPHCKSKVIDQVLIPITAVDRIGGPTIQ